MAKFTYEPDREFLATLGRMAEIEKYVPKMLMEAAPIVQEKLKSSLREHQVTGRMVKSIKPTKIFKNEYGYYLVVRPTGKGENGVRNMQKFMHLELGTSHQAPQPVIEKVIADVQPEVDRKMQEVFERETGIG